MFISIKYKILQNKDFRSDFLKDFFEIMKKLTY